MNFLKRFLLTAAAAAYIAAPASAETITLDFEVAPGPDGIIGTVDDGPMPTFGWIRDEYTSMGITFTQGTVMQAGFYDGNPDNHFISSTSPIGFFTIPVFGISIESHSMWNATLSAFDVAGNLLVSHKIFNSTGGFEREVLSVSSSTAIYSFSVLPDDMGPQLGPILNLDNMVLAVSAVPEPAAPAMLLAGLGLIALVRRKTRRQ